MLKFSELTPDTLSGMRHQFQSALVVRSEMVGIKQIDNSTPPNESLLLLQIAVMVTTVGLLCSPEEQKQICLVSDEIIRQVSNDNSILEIKIPKEKVCPECLQTYMAIGWEGILCPGCDGAGADINGCY
jgi:hypothetical protein